MPAKWALMTLFALGLARPGARYRHDGGALLPDPALTPGAVVPGAARQAICQPGYAAAERDVTASLKRRVYAEYGARPKPGVCCEVDHLISLELGGSNAIRNLWPEPYLPQPGAREKDRLEDYLHGEVCAGRLPLGAARRELSGDWARYWRAMPKARP